MCLCVLSHECSQRAVRRYTVFVVFIDLYKTLSQAGSFLERTDFGHFFLCFLFFFLSFFFTVLVSFSLSNTERNAFRFQD